jgi:cell division protein FtsL
MKMKNLAKQVTHTEELAGRIARTIIRTQISLANFLNAKINRLSKGGKIIYLIAFIVVSAVLNICLVI